MFSRPVELVMRVATPVVLGTMKASDNFFAEDPGDILKTSRHKKVLTEGGCVSHC